MSRYEGHNIYNPAKSSTAKKASGAWNISYGDGSSASGNVYAETVTVGDIAIAGQAGVEAVIKNILEDFELSLGLAGYKSIADIQGKAGEVMIKVTD